MMGYYKLILGFCLTITIYADNQPLVDYLAQNLQIQYKVLTNLESSDDGAPRTKGRLELTNIGDKNITDRQWQINFCSIRIWQPDILREDAATSVLLGDTGLVVRHLTGCLHELTADRGWQGFPVGLTLVVPFETSDWQASRTDVSPNWYLTSPGTTPRLLFYTMGEELTFVEDFNTPEQYKRRSYDNYKPYTAPERYKMYGKKDSTTQLLPLIPTPHSYELKGGRHVDFRNGEWLIVAHDISMMKIAQFLAAKLEVSVSPTNILPDGNYISLALGDIMDKHNKPVLSNEAYKVLVTPNVNGIVITGASLAGLRYGAQTLIALQQNQDVIPEVEIIDYPRFSYRGMHVDVARHFHDKNTIIKLVEVMGMYKLNKLHLHLSDDEGWRLEIPSLPELTDVGGVQCHDPSEITCILPQFGSGPFKNDSGSGFYSRREYREVLRYAEDNGIEVIPEFDMPGHGRAAIKAMESRHQQMEMSGLEQSEKYLLSDLTDLSEYMSIQSYRDNAINPCLQSTYSFIRLLVSEIKALHEDIQPLKTFHFGGDEVPEGAWSMSDACHNKSSDLLKQHFVTQVSKIVASEGLQLAGWEDGVMWNSSTPYDRESLANENVYAYAWNNIWEWGGGSRANTLANNDFKVVLAHATSLYFDHPYEPDPEERGFYWATRYTDTYKVFKYQPDDIYENIEVDLWGKPLQRENICRSFGCPPLEPGKIENIVGMQGQLWSETVRTREQFDYMVYPRLLALAERAWHTGDWEGLEDKKQKMDTLEKGWKVFANTIGNQELKRLDKINVKYRIPPPGAVVRHDGELHANTVFPGLPIEFSSNGGDVWTMYEHGSKVPYDSVLHLRTLSTDKKRQSRIVSLKTPISPPKANTTASATSLIPALKIIFILSLFVTYYIID